MSRRLSGAYRLSMRATRRSTASRYLDQLGPLAVVQVGEKPPIHPGQDPPLRAHRNPQRFQMHTVASSMMRVYRNRIGCNCVRKQRPPTGGSGAEQPLIRNPMKVATHGGGTASIVASERCSGWQLLGRQHAKNPEGVSAETLTLSGFPTRWNSKPRKVGLPVGYPE